MARHHFKLIRRRKPSMKTLLGVTGAKRRARNHMKRAFGLSSRTRTTRSHRRKGLFAALLDGFFKGVKQR